MLRYWQGSLRVTAHDAALWELLPRQPHLERIASGFRFTEGPVWVAASQTLYFSDIPASRIYGWSNGKHTVYRQPSGHANGLTLDGRGRLIACEHSTRRVMRTEPDGTITVLADTYSGKRLNSPNDVVVKRDGSIYFTDPPYGIQPHQREQPHNGVYRIAPDGMLSLLTDILEGPNGLAFSPDESRLYVDDSMRRHLRVFDVQADGTLTGGAVVYDMNTPAPGNPDGMKLDVCGNLYVTGPGGVWVFSPQLRHLGTIDLPEIPANCAWGDDGRSLYITARTSVYRLRLLVGGALLSS
jgi:gluconolactonase